MFTNQIAENREEGEIPSSPNERVIGVKQVEDKLIVTHAWDETAILNDCYNMKKETKHSWSKGRKSPVGRHIGRVSVARLNDWIKAGLVYEDPITGHIDMRGVFAMLNKHPEFKTTKKTL